jgi:hypothetical protein
MCGLCLPLFLFFSVSLPLVFDGISARATGHGKHGNVRVLWKSREWWYLELEMMINPLMSVTRHHNQASPRFCIWCLLSRWLGTMRYLAGVNPVARYSRFSVQWTGVELATAGAAGR